MISTIALENVVLARRTDILKRNLFVERSEENGTFVLHETIDGRIVKVPKLRVKKGLMDYVCEGSDEKCIGFRYK